MIELRNEEERKQYIHDLWIELFGEEPTELKDEFIDVGAMNFVFRIESGSKIIYLKQALEEAKNKAKIGKDLASIPQERIQYEDKYIETIGKHLPKEIELPQILKYDKENNILVVSDVKKDGFLLETSMLDGNFNEKTAYNLGKFLGISHKVTYDKKIVLRGNEEEDLSNWHVFLNMRTRGILQKGDFPEDVKSELNKFYDAVKEKHTYDVVINMDVCPKNVFERKNGSVGIIDFELAGGVGDPAYDLGFLMGHYLLIGAIKKEKIEDAIKAMKQVLKGYDEEMQGLKDKDYDKRVIKYAGAVMVYRITGSSPAPYIQPEAIPLIKETAFSIITNKFEKWNDVFEFLKESFAKN